MRESYRDKQNRKARIAKEKEQKSFDRKNSKKQKSSYGFKDAKRNFDNNSYDSNKKKGFSNDRNSFKEKRYPKERSLAEIEQSLRDNRDDRENVVDENSYEDVVAGRNAVLELLKSNKDINKIFVERGEKHGSINEIIAKAKDARIVLVEVDRTKLDSMAENHQGVVAIVPPFNYCEVEDILEEAQNKNEDPFIIILDGIEDPHNLGSIIRTAETAGVHGIIIPKRRNAAVNSTVTKVSAGATTYMKIARVTNINDTIRKLKDAGLWVIGTDGSAETLYYNQDLKGPLAVIIGSEGFGMSKLVKENADILIKIPMKGKITSLNASVSAGIVIYEAVKQRN
jgi:23S rRNA (guanosine2251-2'-O)-methyltransferase